MIDGKIVKVCGMRDLDNIRSVITTGADWVGFIFYPRSSRYVGQEREVLKDNLQHAGKRIKKVGVFVDATEEQILELVDVCGLDFVQLHGNESPDMCYSLQKRGIALIKALPVATADDLTNTQPYEGRVDYFLFDTKTENYGGSGQLFDWNLLSAYQGETPFLLSGGLSSACLPQLLAFHHPCLAGIDLNSGFEVAPARKDADLLHQFITNYKRKYHE